MLSNTRVPTRKGETRLLAAQRYALCPELTAVYAVC
jgi:hypothetical protein